MDPESDSLLQRSVETVWLSLLEQIEKAAPGQEKCVLSIPFSQGLLFGEMLWAHQTKAAKNGKFTVILNDRPLKMDRNSLDKAPHVAPKKEKSSRSSSAADLRERISHPSESPNYLQKFLEISESMLECEKERKKEFTVSAVGFDREFFKTALFHHYPGYIHSIASKQKRSNPGLLQVVMKRGVCSLDDLQQKIDRLKSLADQVGRNTSQVFGSPFRYQDPANLESHPHFLSCKKNPSTESGPSNWMSKEGGKVFRASSDEIEMSQPFFRRREAEADDPNLSAPYSPLSFQEETETDILSDWELPPAYQNEEYVNWVVQRLTDLVQRNLEGRTPKSTQSDNWKPLWASVQDSRQPKLSQSKIRELVSLKCELAGSSFELLPYLNKDQEELGLSKTIQMKSIDDSQIERSIYPQGARECAANVYVNGKELLSEPLDWNRDVSLNYFSVLLTELLLAQQKYSPRKAQQLLAGLFDFAKVEIHPISVQDISIQSMLKAATFGFGANVFWILKSFFPPKSSYEVFDKKDYKPTLEFFTDEFRNCTTVRTAAFSLLRARASPGPKQEVGIFITKLISSFSGATNKWSFRVEISKFEPSAFCSLREQKEIHKKLLGKNK